MKKRLICIALISCLMLTLAGCGNNIPEMTEEQQALVTEYAAALLLKYDTSYEPMLLDDKRLAEEEEMQKKIEEEAARIEAREAEKEAAKQERAQAEEASQEATKQEAISHVDPAEFLGMENISISCNGVEFKDSYPDNGDELFFSVNASEGCKLALIHLEIINTGNVESDVDIFDKNAKFKVSFNGGEYHNTMVTLLEDDFSMYIGTLAPGAKADTILMVDLNEAECVQPDAISLYIKCNGETVKTAIY